MIERMPKILLPGAVALLVSTAGQRLLWQVGWGPTMTFHYYRGLVDVHGWGGIPLHWGDAPWLLVMVLSGALAAWLCRWMGGNWRQRLWAAELPVLAMLALISAFIFIGLPIEYLYGSLAPARELMVAWLSFMLTNILLPGVALLVGAAPLLALRASGRLSRA